MANTKWALRCPIASIEAVLAFLDRYDPSDSEEYWFARSWAASWLRGYFGPFGQGLTDEQWGWFVIAVRDELMDNSWKSKEPDAAVGPCDSVACVYNSGG